LNNENISKEWFILFRESVGNNFQKNDLCIIARSTGY